VELKHSCCNPSVKRKMLFSIISCENPSMWGRHFCNNWFIVNEYEFFFCVLLKHCNQKIVSRRQNRVLLKHQFQCCWNTLAETLHSEIDETALLKHRIQRMIFFVSIVLKHSIVLFSFWSCGKTEYYSLFIFLFWNWAKNSKQWYQRIFLVYFVWNDQKFPTEIKGHSCFIVVNVRL